MAIEGIFYVHAKVADLARAKRFYGEMLGWKLNTDEAYVAGFWFGTGYLVAQLDSNRGREQSVTGGMHIAVRVSDVDAEHATLTKRGVAVTAIQERPWGERNFSFTDPDGYVWEYGQPT